MSEDLAIYSFVASAVCSFLLLLQKEKKTYWVFVPYLLLIMSLEIYMKWLSDHNVRNLWVANIISVCSIVFYISVISGFIENKKVRYIGYSLAAAFVLFFAFSCKYIMPIQVLHSYELSIGYFLVVCTCIFFLYELLSVPSNVQLLRYPPFWIATAALFNHAGQLPVYLFVNFIVKQKFFSVTSIFFMLHFLDIMLNVLLIIAFVCRLTLPKRSLSYS